MGYKEQKEKVKQLTEQLEKGVENLFESGAYKNYLTVMGKFYRYSANNCFLIMLQRPEATHVAGYNAWVTKFKRHVKKGEKGICILSPAPYKQKKEPERNKTETTGEEQISEESEEKEEIQRMGFKVAYVYDISQTEGEPLPELVHKLEGDVDGYEEFLEILKEVSSVPIGFEEIGSGANGYYHLGEKRIAIQEGMGEEQTVKTAIHEITHSFLHDRDVLRTLGEKPDRVTKEVEAESVAYVVCQHFGIDSSDYTFGYLAGWSGDKKMPQLKASLQTIQKTAGEIIEKIEEKYRERYPERYPDMETESDNKKMEELVHEEKVEERNEALQKEIQKREKGKKR